MGQQQPQSLAFGASQATQAPAFNFSTTTTSAPTAFGFGSTVTSSAAPTAFGFGQPTATAQPSLFGNTGFGGFGASTTGGFGTATSAAPAFGQNTGFTGRIL